MHYLRNWCFRLLKVLSVFVLIYLQFNTLKAQEDRVFRVGCFAFYNVENLFDTINDPAIRDDDWTPKGEVRWNTEKYLHKLDMLSEAIEGIGLDFTPDGAAVLGLAEIENEAVLHDLANTRRLRNRKYEIIYHQGPDRRGMDVALMYQPKYFKPTNSKSYRLTVEDRPDFRTRDPLVVSGLFDGEMMHFIVNHWPSRRGGERRSMPMRMAAAQLNRHIVDSLLTLDPMSKILVMGDFNDNPTNKSITQGLRSKGAVKNVKPDELYNPFYNMYRRGIGTNAWRDAWSLFDQILVSHGLLGDDYSTYKFMQARVFNKIELTQKSGRFRGYPWRTYVGGTHLGGYSDHFPVYVILLKEVEN